MQSFLEWQFSNNNWVGPTILFTVLFLWAAALGANETKKTKAVLFLVVFLGVGTTLNYLASYQDGYRKYANHYTTCYNPEAVAASYKFNPKTGRCYKPIIGWATVDNHDVIEAKGK